MSELYSLKKHFIKKYTKFQCMHNLLLWDILYREEFEKPQFEKRLKISFKHNPKAIIALN